MAPTSRRTDVSFSPLTQGRVAEASELITATIDDSLARGEGLGVDLARWAAAILNNSVSRYPEALAMAFPASADSLGLVISTWMCPERVEAGVRCGEHEVAAAALAEFEQSANHVDSDWAIGIGARSRAMLSDGDVAEGWYREAIDRLSRAQLGAELARAHLVYGEWLRRNRRRVDGREQLRTAHEMFVAMSADGFAERARRELLATGERVRPRRVDSPTELTRRRSTSLAWPGTVGRMWRLAPSSTSAHARSSGICARSSPSWGSPPDAASRMRCRLKAKRLGPPDGSGPDSADARFASSGRRARAPQLLGTADRRPRPDFWRSPAIPVPGAERIVGWAAVAASQRPAI